MNLVETHFNVILKVSFLTKPIFNLGFSCRSIGKVSASGNWFVEMVYLVAYLASNTILWYLSMECKLTYVIYLNLL